MKLYLSSYRIPVLDELVKLVGKPIEDIRVGIVPNAKDYYASRARDFKIKEQVAYFRGVGFRRIRIIDLSTYVRPADLRAALYACDLVWVSGGNTFCLMDAMVRSGFADMIHELVAGGLVYAGESAGACAAGNSLKSIEYADEPAFTETVHWRGLKLIDAYLLPHVGSTMFGDAISKAQAEHHGDPTLLELTDYQAVIVDGTSRRIVEGMQQL